MKKSGICSTEKCSAEAHARAAVRRAQELVDSLPDRGHSAGWYYEAQHVGDLSVLALTLQS